MKTAPLTKDESWIPRGEKILILAIAVLALILRLVYHYEMRGNPLAELLQLDEQFHDRWARSIAAGNIMGEEVFFRAPLYPYLLGLFYFIFGPGPEIPRIIQHLLGSGLVVLVYILSRHLFGKIAAVVAALLCALYSVLVYFEGKLLFDSVVTFLSFTWLTGIVLSMDKSTLRGHLLLAFLFGVICTIRPPFLSLAPPLYGFILWKYLRGNSQLPRFVLTIGIAMFIPILIVTARNAIVGDDCVLLASQGGINFYIGNNPESNGRTSAVPEAGGVAWENRQVEYIAEKALGYPPKPSEVSSYWFSRGMDFLGDQPFAFLTLTLKKLYFFWSHVEISNNQSYYWFERASSVLQLLPVGFWLVGALGLAGAALAWNQPRARVLILFIATYCAITVLFFVCDRFRLPVVPILCVFSGYAVCRLVNSVTKKNWRVVATTIVIVLLAAVLVNSTLFELRADDGTGEDEIHALAALESGNLEAAAMLFERVAVKDPNHYGARVNQGIALWGMGKTREAAAAFHAGLDGDSYFAALNLAHMYFTMRLPDSVGFYAMRAMELRPYGPGGYVIAAKNLLAVGRTQEAQNVLLRGRVECGEDFIYGEYLLGTLHFQSGGLAAADSMYRVVQRRTVRVDASTYAIESEKAQFGEDMRTLHGRSLQGLGRVFAAREELDSSAVYFQAALDLLPTKADAWADWGVCLLRMDRLEEAERALRKSLEIDGRNPWVWLNYGSVLGQREKFDECRQALMRAVALNPNLREAAEMLRHLDESNGQ